MQTQTISLQAAEKVLHALQRRLQKWLEQPLSWDNKRQEIEALVK
ncbi:hypothetical protein KSC_006310 [Ktedonobacter sp. SOSP1-52]|nr:hypothetical protein [Ktedonobacter sp. SOSP1-52]GHO61739.1 hypothetical protein KSC_006310 [Ktedonobacter sp. SOSP1-52]